MLNTRSAILALTLVTLLAVPDTAAAHGGAYRGPGGRVPPDAREPFDPPPPASSWNSDRSAKSDGPPNVIMDGYADWSFWWERRKERVLDNAIAGRRERPDADEIRRWVVPTLRRLLAERNLNFDIQSAVALALARIGDKASAPTLRRLASQQIPDAEGNVRKDAHRVVEETAAVALGLLDDGDEETARLLRALVRDTRAYASYVRPFAAYALALRKGDANVDATREALLSVMRQKERKPDVRPASLIALSLLDDGSAFETLLAVAEGRALAEPAPKVKLGDRAGAIAALATVRVDHERRGIDALIALVNAPESGVLRLVAVESLGRLGGRSRNTSHRRQILETLLAWLRPDEPVVQRAHLVQALGLLAAAPNGGASARGELRALLSAETSPGVRSTAAVCLGLAARADGPGAKRPNAQVRSLLASTTAPHERAAYALTVGLLRDHEAVPALRAIVTDAEQDPELRGYSALALGLLEAGEATQEIIDAIATSTDTALRVQCHLALGLLGGEAARRRSLDVLVEGAEDERFHVLGAAAWSLGANPHIDSLPLLLACVEDRGERMPDIVRALAATAVGQICARPGAPSLNVLREALPARISTPSSFELLTIL